MGYINIAILVLLGLALIIGLIKGFSVKRISLVIFGLSCFVGYLAGLPVGKALMGTGIGYDWLTPLYGGLLPETSTFQASLSADPTEMLQQISTGLGELKIPSFFHSFFTSNIMDQTTTVGNAIASSFALLTLKGVSFLFFFILSMVLMYALLRPVWKVVFGEDGKNIFGRLFGAIYTVAKCTLVILVLFVVLSFVNNLMLRYDNTVLNDFLAQDMKLYDQDAFSIGRMFYNTAEIFISWVSGK